MKTTSSKEMKYIKIFLVISSIAWFISLIIAPLTLPENTVILGDEGRANIVDYAGLWNKLPLYHRIVYFIGDLGCHQKASRSFYINSNQMPVCSRCTGIFLGIAIVLPLFYFLEYFRSTIYKAIVENLFSKHRTLFILLYILFTAPLVADGLTQTLGLRESTNLIRFITGLMFSSINSIVFYHYLLEEGSL